MNQFRSFETYLKEYMVTHNKLSDDIISTKTGVDAKKFCQKNCFNNLI